MINDLLSKVRAITPPAYQWRLALIILASAVLALFDSALVLVIGPIVEGAMKGATPQVFSTPIAMHLLLGLAGVVLLLKNVLLIGLARWKHTVLFHLQAHFSSEMLHRILCAHLPRSLDAGKKSSYVITEPLYTILNIYAPGIAFAAELSLIVFLTASLLLINPIETIVLFGTLTILIGLFQWGTRGWLRVSGIRRKDADGRRHEIVRALIDCETDVRALNWRDRVMKLYDIPNRVSSDMTSNKTFATEIIKSVVELAVIIGVGLLILASRTTTAAELAPLLAVFGAAAYRLAPSFNRMMTNTQSIRFGLSSLDVLHETLTAPSSYRASAPPTLIDKRPLDIKVQVERLLNPSGVTLVEDVGFTLGPGDVLVVSGPSGIGKTSLIKALVDGAPGVHIAVNGIALTAGLSQCGLAVGMAGQKPFVLPASLAYNVLLNADIDSAPLNESTSRIEREVLLALADHHQGSVIESGSIVENLNQSIDVSSLSGGQGQRIALMRAILHGRDIILLDEPTSALDHVTRDRFMDLLRTVLSTRIIIIVSHDPALECIATQVLKLNSQR